MEDGRLTPPGVNDSLVYCFIRQQSQSTTNNISLLCDITGGQKSKIKVLAGPLWEDPFLTLPASGGGLVAQLCPTLATPWTVARQAPLSVGFPRQEYWSGLPFHSPGDLPNPGIESVSPALAGRFFTTKPHGKPLQLLVVPGILCLWQHNSISTSIFTWLTSHCDHVFSSPPAKTPAILD